MGDCKDIPSALEIVSAMSPVPRRSDNDWARVKGGGGFWLRRPKGIEKKWFGFGDVEEIDEGGFDKG